MVTVELNEKIAPLMLMEYQSSERDRPSIQCGVSTMPPDTVVDASGCWLGLLSVSSCSFGVVTPPLNGSGKAWKVLLPVENSSLILGARMSKDQVVRRRMSSLTWLFRPSFQVSTRPLVE